jgi:hypothetical protein
LPGSPGPRARTRSTARPSSSDSITVAGNGSVSGRPVLRFLLVRRRRPGSERQGRDRGQRARDAAGHRASSRPGLETSDAVGPLSQIFTDNGEPSGFAASNLVTATIGLDKAGARSTQQSRRAPTAVNGPTMSVADQSSLYRQASRLPWPMRA